MERASEWSNGLEEMDIPAEAVDWAAVTAAQAADEMEDAVQKLDADGTIGELPAVEAAESQHSADRDKRRT